MQLRRNRASCFFVSTRVSDSEFNDNRNWNLNLTFHCCEALWSTLKQSATSQDKYCPQSCHCCSEWLIMAEMMPARVYIYKKKKKARRLQKPGGAGMSAGSWARGRRLPAAITLICFHLVVRLKTAAAGARGRERSCVHPQTAATFSFV